MLEVLGSHPLQGKFRQQILMHGFGLQRKVLGCFHPLFAVVVLGTDDRLCVFVWGDPE